jgi:hypothetical protein
VKHTNSPLALDIELLRESQVAIIMWRVLGWGMWTTNRGRGTRNSIDLFRVNIFIRRNVHAYDYNKR